VFVITKKEKLLNRINSNLEIVKFEELDKILQDVGFDRRQPSGGSIHYTYGLVDKILTVPYKKPYIKVIYVKMAIKLLEDLG
jgi:hypothetical protein